MVLIHFKDEVNGIIMIAPYCIELKLTAGTWRSNDPKIHSDDAMISSDDAIIRFDDAMLRSDDAMICSDDAMILSDDLYPLASPSPLTSSSNTKIYSPTGKVTVIDLIT